MNTQGSYPSDGWLRGYFREGDETGHPVRGGRVRRNVDFLRLNDAALLLFPD